MQFLTAAIAAAILGFTNALPTPQSTIPTGSNILVPTAISQYTVWTGAVNFNTGAGKIFKNGIVSDVTTLVTFDIPASAAGSTCVFHFALDPSATLSGSEQFDVFTSLATATTSTTTWPSGNLRDQYVGRMTAVLNGEATWTPGFPNVPSFPCPAGQLLAGELVGTGDVDDIEWLQSVAGPYIEIV
jgi:Ubiquitin 3 binding protein But2 C-terminal domain